MFDNGRKIKRKGFSPFIQEKDKISESLSTKRRERDEEIERQNWEAKREREERVRARDTRTTTTREEILGGEVRSRVTRGGEKARDGNGRKN